MGNKHKNRVHCEQCEKTFARIDSKKRHEKHIHEGIREYKCKFCKHFSKTDAHRTKHEKICVKNRTCYRCNFVFESAVVKREHIKSCNTIHVNSDSGSSPFSPKLKAVPSPSISILIPSIPPPALESTIIQIVEKTHKCECGRICKSKAGLTMHKKSCIGKPYKPKATIPKPLRKKVWESTYGKQYEAVCYVCQDNLLHANDGFECGHIISEASGGKLHLNNLKAICGTCNKSMGTTHMYEFIKKIRGDHKFDMTGMMNAIDTISIL
jgi:hypothetical protein